MHRISLLFSLTVLLGLQAKTQVNSTTRSIEETVQRTLELLSAKPENQNWDEFRMLFLPSADLVVVSDNSLGQKTAHAFSLEEFVRTMKRNTSGTPFQEKQLRLDVVQYNGIAHALQTYEVTIGENTHKGLNSFQLVFEDGKWWIANVIWANDANGVAVPQEFLPVD